MYITNIEESFPPEKLYLCGNLIASYLMETKKIPLAGRTKNKKFAFIKTEQLKNALDEMPFWFNIGQVIT